MSKYDLNAWASTLTGVRDCLRMMRQSANPYIFRGIYNPRRKAAAPRAVRAVEMPTAPPDLRTQVEHEAEMKIGDLARKLGTTPEELLAVLRMLVEQSPQPPAPGQATPVQTAIAKCRLYGFHHVRAIACKRAQRAEIQRKARALR
jgi:hypothetical protein